MSDEWYEWFINSLWMNYRYQGFVAFTPFAGGIDQTQWRLIDIWQLRRFTPMVWRLHSHFPMLCTLIHQSIIFSIISPYTVTLWTFVCYSFSQSDDIGQVNFDLFLIHLGRWPCVPPTSMLSSFGWALHSVWWVKSAYHSGKHIWHV